MTMMVQGRLFKFLHWRDEGMPTSRQIKLTDDAQLLENALNGPSWEAIKLRIADVVLDAAVIAWHNNTTIEECLDLKIQLERNRKEESRKKKKVD